MNGPQLAILAWAIGTALVSYRLPHAVLWICLAGADAVACDLYRSAELAYPAAFALASDALLCLAIHWLARERWELRLFNIYQLSVLISVLRLPSMIAPEYAYDMLQELCNWAALFLIAGTARLEGLGARGIFPRGFWGAYIHRAYSHLRAPRSTPHWTKE